VTELARSYILATIGVKILSGSTAGGKAGILSVGNQVRPAIAVEFIDRNGVRTVAHSEFFVVIAPPAPRSPHRIGTWTSELGIHAAVNCRMPTPGVVSSGTRKSTR
jgi:hypothetical protein